MRIGLYDPYLDTLSGGEKYMLTAASYLAQENEVSVFWNDESILQKAQEKLNIDLTQVTVKPNFFSSQTPIANKLLETTKYDRIIILSDGSIPITLAKKTILHFQHPVEWVNANSVKTKLKLKKIDKIICNSLFTKKFIDKKFGLESVVLYPPCLSEDEYKKISVIKQKKKNIIVTVGRYSPLENGSDIKKLGIMVDLFKSMIDQGLRNWEFMLAVSSLKENEKKLDELDKTIKDYPIKIIKNTKIEDLKKLYSLAKIYWHAAGFEEDIEKHPERAEHFGITTVEAMAYKVVPVVFAQGGQLEIVDNNINGFYWETKEELIQLSKKLMIDESFREEIGKLSTKKAQLFTTEKFCKNLQSLIK